MKKSLWLIAFFSTLCYRAAGQSGEVADTIPTTVVPDSTLVKDSLITDTLRTTADSLTLSRDTLQTNPQEEKKSESDSPSENKSEETDAPAPKPPTPVLPKTKLSAGQFQVIMLKGTVTNRRTGLALKPKTIIRRDDPLQFSSAGNRLALIDERKNTFIGRPKSNLTQYDLQPIQAKFNTRPGKILNYIAFVKYLEGRDFLVLGGKAGIEVGPEEFPMNQDHFFYIQYAWTGDPKPVNKRLSYDGTVLFFDRTEIFRVDDRPIDPSQTSHFKLFYYDDVEKTSTLINTFTIVFPDETEVQAAVQVLIDHFGTADRTALVNAIESFLFEEYGVPEKQNLTEWLQKNFGL